MVVGPCGISLVFLKARARTHTHTHKLSGEFSLPFLLRSAQFIIM
jgi:hypothetical protein